MLEHVRFCVHSFKSEISVSSTPVGCLRLNSIGFQSHMPWRITFLVQDSQTGELNMGLRTLTAMGEPPLYNCSPVCGTLEKEMATSSILAWDIPRIVEPWRAQVHSITKSGTTKHKSTVWRPPSLGVGVLFVFARWSLVQPALQQWSCGQIWP